MHQHPLRPETRNAIVHRRVHSVNRLPPSFRLNPARSGPRISIKSFSTNDLPKTRPESLGQKRPPNGQKRPPNGQNTAQKRQKSPSFGHNFAPKSESLPLRIYLLC